MRFLLCRTDGIGDLVVSLPVQNCILEREPSAEVFWLVKPDTAPILDHLPGVSGVLHRPPDADLERLIEIVGPNVLLNLGHRDRMIVPAAKRAKVPIRVAKQRGIQQTLAATHIIWGGSKRGYHESQYSPEFLKKIKWPVPKSLPPPPKLVLTQEEIVAGKAEIQCVPAPRLGVIVSGKTCISPSSGWWAKMLEASRAAQWSPIVLSPADRCELPSTGLRGLMARLHACDAVLGVSTGPTHLSAALGVPTLCLMDKSQLNRWRLLGNRAESLAYPDEKADLGYGTDRFSFDAVLTYLEKLRSAGPMV